MIISPIQPSPATMAKVEKAHVFLQRRWGAREQQPELQRQNSRAAFKRKVAHPTNVSTPILRENHNAVLCLLAMQCVLA